MVRNVEKALRVIELTKIKLNELLDELARELRRSATEPIDLAAADPIDGEFGTDWSLGRPCWESDAATMLGHTSLRARLRALA